MKNERAGKKRRVSLWLVLPLVGLLGAGGLYLWKITPPADLRVRAKAEHGIVLPASAKNIQCRGDYWSAFLDRGAVTMFEMESSEQSGFVSTLKVRSRTGPVSADPADPRIGGYNVWPQGTPSVPSNPQYSGFAQTWTGDALPVESLACVSTTGDWMNVEYWKLPGSKMLVKVCTDWN